MMWHTRPGYYRRNMTGILAGWAIPVPHTHIGDRLRALFATLISVDQRRQTRPERSMQPLYPERRPAMFEEAAMAREMYRL